MTTVIDTFRAFHESGCFVIPNPWDIGTARFLEHAGFKALATTSAGFSFTRGLPDELTSISRDDMLAHIREVVSATKLPVNADFQAGFADDAEGVARNVTMCVATGVAGLSIEDACDEGGLHDREAAIERLRAARRAIDASGVPVVLTARCEAFLTGDADAKRTVLDRLVAFADAGADCLFAPGIRDLETLADVVRAVAPKPVNAIVAWSSPGFTVAELAAIGVRRISVGSALSRVAWGAFMRSAREIAEAGTFASFGDAASFAELNKVFA